MDTNKPAAYSRRMNSHSHSSRTSGFSLVEAAIVLAIVGLVIGGIWIAASVVSENYRMNRAISFLIGTATDLQNKWKGSIWTAETLLSKCVANAGMAPADFVNPNGYDDCAAGWQNPAYPHALNTLWGTPIRISVVPGDSLYYITFIDLPAEQCKKMIATVTGRVGKNSTMIAGVYVWGFGGFVTSANFPISIGGTACAGALNSVQFGVPIL